MTFDPKILAAEGRELLAQLQNQNDKKEPLLNLVKIFNQEIGEFAEKLQTNRYAYNAPQLKLIKLEENEINDSNSLNADISHYLELKCKGLSEKIADLADHENPRGKIFAIQRYLEKFFHKNIVLPDEIGYIKNVSNAARLLEEKLTKKLLTHEEKQTEEYKAQKAKKVRQKAITELENDILELNRLTLGYDARLEHKPKNSAELNVIVNELMNALNLKKTQSMSEPAKKALDDALLTLQKLSANKENPFLSFEEFGTLDRSNIENYFSEVILDKFDVICKNIERNIHLKKIADKEKELAELKHPTVEQHPPVPKIINEQKKEIPNPKKEVSDIPSENKPVKNPQDLKINNQAPIKKQFVEQPTPSKDEPKIALKDPKEAKKVENEPKVTTNIRSKEVQEEPTVCPAEISTHKKKDSICKKILNALAFPFIWIASVYRYLVAKVKGKV